MRLPFFFLPFCLMLTGCSLQTTTTPPSEAGTSLSGSVHGGEQPIVSAHVYLLAASTSGYGAASNSLISSGAAGTDSIGSYVLSGSRGQFTITGDYTCTLGQQVYIYSLGGNPGAGTNLASGMMAAVGSCPAAGNLLATVPFIAVNELSTVAFAYAASGFAVDPLHIASSGTALANTGLANAFATSANLVPVAGGPALSSTPAGNGAVPNTEINTVANILAACVNSDGTVAGPSNPTPCYTLFNNAKNGSALPTDTAGAAINIVHNPTANVAALFNLQAASPVFAPALSSAPTDYTLNLTFTGGGLSTSTAQIAQTAFTYNNIAIDASGNVWKPNYGANTLTELNSLGAPVSGSSGFSGGGLNQPANVAVDLSGNIWTGNFGGSSVSEFSPAGTPVAGSPFAGGGISTPINLAIDASNNIWVLNPSTLSELSNAGTAASGSPYASNALNQPVGIAILPSGNVWVSSANSNSVAVYTSTGAAAPGSPYTAGALNAPYGIAFDSSGDGWIADYSAITELSSTGAPGNSPFNAPPQRHPHRRRDRRPQPHLGRRGRQQHHPRTQLQRHVSFGQRRLPEWTVRHTRGHRGRRLRQRLVLHLQRRHHPRARRGRRTRRHPTRLRSEELAPRHPPLGSL